MTTIYPKRKYRAGVRYVTVGVKEPRVKNNEHWTPELRQNQSVITKARWTKTEYKENIVQKQVTNRHPWRQAFNMGPFSEKRKKLNTYSV